MNGKTLAMAVNSLDQNEQLDISEVHKFPHDPECPRCGWPHKMNNVWDALICTSCNQSLWWVFDIDNFLFRLVPMNSRRFNPDLVRYYHPKAKEALAWFDDMCAGIKNRRIGRKQRWSELAEPYDEALFEEGADK